MLQEQIDAHNLSRKPGNPMTVVEAPYKEDLYSSQPESPWLNEVGKNDRRRELAQMDAARGGLAAYRPSTDWNYNPRFGR